MASAAGGAEGRVRTKPTLDWYATQNLTDRSMLLATSEAEKLRHKAVRQNSYLAAVRGPTVKPAGTFIIYLFVIIAVSRLVN